MINSEYGYPNDYDTVMMRGIRHMLLGEELTFLQSINLSLYMELPVPPWLPLHAFVSMMTKSSLHFADDPRFGWYRMLDIYAPKHIHFN
jgi:hypothetical protein